MSISGQGTSVDPYIPTTWEEFLQCTASDNNYTELPEGGGVFDMRDYYTDGEVHNISLRGFINGNGWIIKNAKVTNTSGYHGYYGFFVSRSISNLNFIDYEVNSNGVAAYRLGYSDENASAALIVCVSTVGQFIKFCKFLGNIKSNQYYSESQEYSVIFDRTRYSFTIYACSFNLNFTKDGSITQGTNWQAALKYCNIRVNAENVFYGSFNYCYIEGNVGGIGSFSHDYDGFFQYSVINANIGSTGFYMDYGQAITVLVNTDKFDGELLTGMIGATTTEMKSKTDLDAIGFTISTDPTATTEWHLDASKNNGFPYIPIMLDIPESEPTVVSDIKIGDNTVIKAYLGDIPASKIYYGDIPVLY